MLVCMCLCLFLCAGTLRPDLIESASMLASGEAAVIKTHHNDSDLVRDLRNQVRCYSSVGVVVVER